MIYEVRQLLKAFKKHYGVDCAVHYGSIFELIGPFTLFSQRNKNNTFIDYDAARALFSRLLTMHCIDRTIPFVDVVEDVFKIRLTRTKARGQKRWTVGDVSRLTDISDFFQRRATNRPRATTSSRDGCIKMYTNARDLPSKILCVDFEMYEFNHSEIMEIGYVTLNPHTGAMSDTVHIIIDDYIHRKNSTYVADNRDRFHYGSSIRMTLEQAAKHLSQLVMMHDGLLSHGGGRSDSKALNQMCGNQHESLLQFNTDHLSYALTGTKRQYKLCNLALQYDIDCNNIAFHNAGNDAHVTARTFLNMLNVLRSVDVQAA